MKKIALVALAALMIGLTAVSAAEPEKIIVPRYKFSYQGQTYYYSPKSQGPTQDELDDFSDRVAEKVVEKLLKRLAEDDKGGKPGDPPGTVIPKAAGAPAPKLSADLQYLGQNCSTCHGPQGTIRGNFRLFTPDGKVDPKVDWWTVWERLSTNDVKLRMPPGKPKAPQSVTDAIVNRARTNK